MVWGCALSSSLLIWCVHWTAVWPPPHKTHEQDLDQHQRTLNCMGREINISYSMRHVHSEHVHYIYVHDKTINLDTLSYCTTGMSWSSPKVYRKASFYCCNYWLQGKLNLMLITTCAHKLFISDRVNAMSQQWYYVVHSAVIVKLNSLPLLTYLYSI